MDRRDAVKVLIRPRKPRGAAATTLPAKRPTSQITKITATADLI
jgi:hypothetical protein